MRIPLWVPDWMVPEWLDMQRIRVPETRWTHGLYIPWGRAGFLVCALDDREESDVFWILALKWSGQGLHKDGSRLQDFRECPQTFDDCEPLEKYPEKEGWLP
jgi:hypothetical protein